MVAADQGDRARPRGKAVPVRPDARRRPGAPLLPGRRALAVHPRPRVRGDAAARERYGRHASRHDRALLRARHREPRADRTARADAAAEGRRDEPRGANDGTRRQRHAGRDPRCHGRQRARRPYRDRARRRAATGDRRARAVDARPAPVPRRRWRQAIRHEAGRRGGARAGAARPRRPRVGGRRRAPQREPLARAPRRRARRGVRPAARKRSSKRAAAGDGRRRTGDRAPRSRRRGAGPCGRARIERGTLAARPPCGGVHRPPRHRRYAGAFRAQTRRQRRNVRRARARPRAEAGSRGGEAELRERGGRPAGRALARRTRRIDPAREAAPRYRARCARRRTGDRRAPRRRRSGNAADRELTDRPPGPWRGRDAGARGRARPPGGDARHRPEVPPGRRGAPATSRAGSGPRRARTHRSPSRATRASKATNGISKTCG